MHQFWEREVKKVHYFQHRFDLRETTFRKNQMNQHHNKQDDHKEKHDQEDDYDLDIPTEEEMEAKYQAFLLEYELSVNPVKVELKENKAKK